jgi:hypothetical protein
MTSFERVVAIIGQQGMHPGQSGLLWAGIYFGLDPSVLCDKALAQSVTVSAEVDLGRVKGLVLKLRSGTWMRTGDEYAVHDANRIKSIAFHSGELPRVCTGTLRNSADGTNGTGSALTSRDWKCVDQSHWNIAQFSRWD